MPNVKDHKHHSKKHQAHDHGEKDPREAMQAASESRPKRRPGREEPEASDVDVTVVDVHDDETHEHKKHAKNGNKAESHDRGHEDDQTHGHKRKNSHDEDQSHSHKHSHSHGHKHDSDERPAVEIRFFGSELLRAKFPQPFDVAEKVASDWVTGGNFENLPIKQPLAQYAAQKGLQRAKEIEKKVLESPVTEKVAMQALTVGLKAQGVFEQIRERLKNQKKD